MIVEEFIANFPETEYSNSGEPVYPREGDKEHLQYEVKCVRSDIQRDYDITEVRYDHDNKTILIEIQPA